MNNNTAKLVGIRFRIEFKGEDDSRTLYDNRLFFELPNELALLPKRLVEVAWELAKIEWEKHRFGSKDFKKHTIIEPIFDTDELANYR
jgi:hypothetical protein